MSWLYKIAVLGEQEAVLGFMPLGLDVFTAESGDEAKRQFKVLSDNAENYAIIYVTETWASVLKPMIDRFRGEISPAVILIPGAAGATGSALAALNETVEKAVGANIL